MHGSDLHSSSSVKHVPTGVSVKPEEHEHVYELTPCEHVPLFKHGDDEHSLTSSLHTVPLYPGLHVHVNESRPGLQVPPFLHGDDAHSFTSASQL